MDELDRKKRMARAFARAYAPLVNFQFSALPRDRFDALFSMSDDSLVLHGARRVIATHRPGFPCRVSLQDAEIGEPVLLVNFEHLGVQTPFRSRYAVYVRQAAQPARLAINEVPEIVRNRALSVRAWRSDGMLAGADLAEGSDIEPVITALLSVPDTAYLHVHFAKPGCYAARVDRA